MLQDIICSPAATQEFSQLPKFEMNKYDGSATMVDPSAHPQNINIAKHLLYV
jgi:hypothetical protein